LLIFAVELNQTKVANTLLLLIIHKSPGI